jgi:thiamine pyrophosphate-dependent acetolactate synthase large subunit-like protein
MPVAQANLGDAFAKHFTTPPALDPVAVALAFGARAMLAKSPVAIAAAVTAALGIPGVTVIHAPVSPSGAHDVRRAALAQVGTA